LLKLLYCRLKKSPGRFYFTDEIMNNQGKNNPVESKPDKEKGRRCIRILVQKFNKRQQGSHQNNFDRR